MRACGRVLRPALLPPDAASAPGDSTSRVRESVNEDCGLSLSAVLGAFLVLCQSAPSARDKYSRKFIRFTNLQSCTIIKYSFSTTHARFESDLTSTLPVLIRVLSTDHVGIKYRSSLDRD